MRNPDKHHRHGPLLHHQNESTETHEPQWGQDVLCVTLHLDYLIMRMGERQQPPEKKDDQGKRANRSKQRQGLTLLASPKFSRIGTRNKTRNVHLGSPVGRLVLSSRKDIAMKAKPAVNIGNPRTAYCSKKGQRNKRRTCRFIHVMKETS